MFNSRTIVLIAAAVPCAQSAPQQVWYPHEGGLMKYRVNVRFGEEPNDTLPDGWKFGRVSSVATDSDNNVYAFQRGRKADPLIIRRVPMIRRSTGPPILPSRRTGTSMFPMATATLAW